MPDLFDPTPATDQPELGGPEPIAPRTGGAGPGRSDAVGKLAKRRLGFLTPTLAKAPVAEHEVFRPLPFGHRRSAGAETPVAVLNLAGVIGDLSHEGYDFLAGYIGRINGVGFRALPCHAHRNPGGFGITLNEPELSPALHKATVYHTLFPEPDSPQFLPWMTACCPRSPAKPAPVTFDDWESGGQALLAYLHLIEAGHIAFFFRGPMTPIADIILRFNGPCRLEYNFPWSTLLGFLDADTPITSTHPSSSPHAA